PWGRAGGAGCARGACWAGAETEAAGGISLWEGGGVSIIVVSPSREMDWDAWPDDPPDPLGKLAHGRLTTRVRDRRRLSPPGGAAVAAGAPGGEGAGLAADAPDAAGPAEPRAAGGGLLDLRPPAREAAGHLQADRHRHRGVP